MPNYLNYEALEWIYSNYWRRSFSVPSIPWPSKVEPTSCTILRADAQMHIHKTTLMSIPSTTGSVIPMVDQSVQSRFSRSLEWTLTASIDSQPLFTPGIPTVSREKHWVRITMRASAKAATQYIRVLLDSSFSWHLSIHSSVQVPQYVLQCWRTPDFTHAPSWTNLAFRLFWKFLPQLT